MAAEAWRRAGREMQLALLFFPVGSHAPEMGRHWKMVARKTEMDQADTRAMRMGIGRRKEGERPKWIS